MCLIISLVYNVGELTYFLLKLKKFNTKTIKKILSVLLMLLQSAKLIAAGLATISITGAGIGIGNVFAALISGVARNSFITKQLFIFAILGFALTEAIALFGLMMAFLILFGF